MATYMGTRRWSGSTDKEGHRFYKLTSMVRADGPTEGPFTVLLTAGLPTVGSYWAIGTDSDPWAFCKRDCTLKPLVDNEKNIWWEVENNFDTKPQDNKDQKCEDEQIDDPLLQPQKVSGSFVKYTTEATNDKDGNPIHNSSFEKIRGPQVEFDNNRPTVRIEQNVPALGLELMAQLMDKVNDTTMWGLPPRCVKLSSASWEKKLYGLCYVYYTRVLEFDINYDTFDRDILDEGTKALHGYWPRDSDEWEVLDVALGVPADPLNPSHFQRVKDRNGENMRVLLKDGVPAESGDDAGIIHVEYYQEGDLFALGVPTTF